MNKQELLQALKAKLSGLPDQDIKKSLRILQRND